MAFCEDCGAPITPGALFCESCGVKLAVPAAYEFSAGSKEIKETGIIYTNLGLLGKKSEKSQDFLNSVIDSFILSAKERGVAYELCDVSDRFAEAGKIREHIKIIKTLVKKNHPKFLFILGSYDVIPSITWENQACDSGSDSDVTSDLPFATLDDASPFYGQTYDFDDCLRVGRLPTVDFENYFANLKAVCGKIEQIKTFGMSAEVWQEETNYIYGNFASGLSVVTSPEVTKSESLSVIPADTNLLLFNLHGSRQTQYWYGQRGSSYPEAIAPESLQGIVNPYFLAVEACYGAYYEGRTADNSVLLNALNGKCVTFLGSSRIAFGTPSPKGCCADVICGEFLKNLKEGLSAGDALNKARSVLMEDDSASVVKTLAEFALYGDPSARMKAPATEKGIFSGRLFGGENAGGTSSKSFAKGIHIPLPDVRRAVRMELTTVDQKIADAVESFVYARHEDLKGIRPKYYSHQNKNYFNAVFENSCAIGPKIVNVRFSKSGEINQMIESK